MANLPPVSFAKRSFVYRQFDGASFSAMGQGAIAENLPNNTHSSAHNSAQQSALLDLTVMARTGFRGANAAAHLEQAGLPVPAKPNQLAVSANGELVLRLSHKEFWILGSLKDDGAAVTQLTTDSLVRESVYPLYCQHSHGYFVMTGQHLADTMAKICGVDLRIEAFPVGAIAQTSLARVNAVIAHHEINGIPAFIILSDISSSEYLWSALLDAMDEFGGQAIGRAALS